jgi:hypothetical protein
MRFHLVSQTVSRPARTPVVTHTQSNSGTRIGHGDRGGYRQQRVGGPALATSRPASPAPSVFRIEAAVSGDHMPCRSILRAPVQVIASLQGQTGDHSGAVPEDSRRRSPANWQPALIQTSTVARGIHKEASRHFRLSAPSEMAFRVRLN